MIHITSSSFRLKLPSVVTVGNFDGLHIGHKELIDIVKKKAILYNLKSVVFTFNPHPRYVLDPSCSQKLISTYAEKKLLIDNMNIDYFIEHPFDICFSQLSALQFFREIIVDKLNCKVLVVGDNFKFGSDRIGDIDLLSHFTSDYNIELIVIDKKAIDGVEVSSSAIRRLLVNNNIEVVNKFLVFPYAILGDVRSGRQLGRTIGFPTVNLYHDSLKLLPACGVYASITIYNNIKYKSVTNIGYNPTVSTKVKSIETYIFDFDKHIYNKTIIVLLLRFIRNEIKFDCLNDLASEIKKDKSVALNYLLKNFHKYDIILS